MSLHTKISLPQDQIPTHWYNVLADLPEPLAPPLHPGTKKVAGPQDLAAMFAPNHAIRAAIDEALEAKTEKRQRVILFNLSGHGFMDMSAYESYLAGKLGGT